MRELNYEDPANDTVRRTRGFLDLRLSQLYRDTDKLFGGLLVFQWLCGILVACTISPRTWAGPISEIHLHVWTSVLLGGAITIFPVVLAVHWPGHLLTRHTIAVAQMLWSALLIHLSGGRIETHFHVFGSLAFLAFYRDWRVLVTASVVVALDHFVRGIYWPMSVFGVFVESPYRWIEHAAWVVFEDVFLIYSCRRNVRELGEMCAAQAQIESLRRSDAKTAKNALEEVVLQLQQRNEELSRNQAHLNAVLNASQDPIVAMDNCGTITSASSSTADVFGCHPDKLIGKHLGTLLPELLTPEHDDCLAKHHAAKESKGAGAVRELTAVRKDGTSFPCEFTLNRTVDTGDVAFMGILRDITARKLTEEELAYKDEQIRQKKKLESIGALAGGVAHEFNNLLQAIRGYTRFAMDELDPSGQPYQDLEQTLAATQRAATLTSQLLGFSRQQNLRREVLNPNQIVTDLAKLLTPVIGEHVELTLSLDDSTGTVMADPGVLQQILLNLAINARDAMPQGGQLNIKTSNVVLSTAYCDVHEDVTPGRYVKISVTDTGCGMAEEVRQRIFDPFFTTKEVGKGTGLGLAMVFGVLKQHGGTIHVYSEEGVGTTFKIYLPSGEKVTAEPEIDDSIVGGSETILFADDDPVVREIGLRILQSAGYEVLVAADGGEAIQLYREHRTAVSLVLTDIVMPKYNGHEVYEHVKQINPDVKVIFCTGYDPDTVLSQGLCDPDVTLLEKPIDPDVLLRTLREILDLPASSTAQLAP